MFRYLDRRGRLRSSYDVKTEWSKPTGTIERAVALILIYALARHLRGQRFARSFVVLMLMFLKLYVVSLSITLERHSHTQIQQIQRATRIPRKINLQTIRSTLLDRANTHQQIAKNLKLGWHYHLVIINASTKNCTSDIQTEPHHTRRQRQWRKVRPNDDALRCALR